MQVSFIIPLYNCLAHTRECLRTLQATLPAGLEHEVIFVDDGSADGTREWLATLGAPCRAVLNEKNLGFAGACNRGAAAAGGELLFFLNNDLVLQSGWFGPMRALAGQPSTGLAGNVQLDAATGAVDHAGIYIDHKGKPAHHRRNGLLARLRGVRTVPAVTGACFAIRAELWRQLGAFDEGFRNGGEDIDLAFKARAAGKENRVALRSVVLHHVSASPGRKLRDEENSCRLARRWRPQLAELALRAWCRHALTLRWNDPNDNADWTFTLGLALYASGLRRTPPACARAGVAAALDTEETRWRSLGLF